MKGYEISIIGEGTARGYSFDEQGLVTLVDLPVIDGQVTDSHGEPYDLDGRMVDLMGWPDSKAVMITGNLAVGVKNSAARALRSVNSPAQQQAARENGKKGGRPKGFIGWEYWDGRNTTTGEPNPDPGTYHGRLSIAGSAEIFRTKKKRQDWIDRAQPGKIREAVSRTELRRLMAGHTKQQFDEYMESLEFDLDVDHDEVNRMIEEDMRR
jgi:hypothetical protein